MNVAIIGASGFIGSHLVEALGKNPSFDLHLFGKRDNSLFGDKHKYYPIDLLNTQQIEKSFKNIDFVYYLASETIPVTSWDNPTIEIEKNLIPFINFIETISKLKVKKVAFLSSAGTVYGETTGNVREDANKQPFSPYGIIKLSMENFLNYYRHKTNLSFDIYRVSNVYGPGQNTSKGLGLINTMLEKIITEGKVSVYGNGENVRNYIYVKDVAEILANALSSDISLCNTLNVSSDDSLSINQIIDLLHDIVEERFDVDYLEKRGSDNTVVVLNNEKLKNMLPEFKFTPILSGITSTYQFIKEQNKIIKA